MHSAIIPDITVESADLEDFINIIYED
jgi:hypothetical protein